MYGAWGENRRQTLMKIARIASATLVVLMLLGTSVLGIGSGRAFASSHREAPLISNDPQADNTDIYAFVSPDKPDTVTVIACFWPFEEPAGGPNYYRVGDDVTYNINIDNVGDAQAHIVYQFKFNTVVGTGNTFLYNTGPID